MSDKPIVQLEGWLLLTLHDRPYQLIGFASGHPLLPGHRRFIKTSRVLSLSDDKARAETVNTHYHLRYPVKDMRFELAFPVFIALADLTAECVGDEQWRISHCGTLVTDDIRGYQAAILRMLDLLDRQCW
jgi:hypothetical protein